MKPLLTLFLLVWGGGVLVADYFAAVGVRRAFRSADWATADGVVTHCELKRGRKSISLDLTYTFTADDREYTGRDYEPGPHFLPASKWPKVQAALSVGTKVTVHYNPDDPADAVLSPGVKPEVFGLLLALTPFNVIATGIALTWWAAVTGRRAFDPARDVRPTADGAGYAARLNGFGPLACFGIALLALSFAGIFLVTVVLHSYAAVPPSWAVDGGIWVGILAVCFLAAWQGGKPRELIEGTDSLTVPDTPTGRATVELPRAAVRGIEVRTETRKAKKGTRDVFVPVLLTTDREVRFAEYTDRRDAEAVAEWVRERLNVGGHDDPD